MGLAFDVRKLQAILTDAHRRDTRSPPATPGRRSTQRKAGNSLRSLRGRVVLLEILVVSPQYTTAIITLDPPVTAEPSRSAEAVHPPCIDLLGIDALTAGP